MYGEGGCSMVEWKAARKPIEQRLSNARKQLSKISRTSVLDRYVGNGKALAGRLGIARSQSAARARRGRRRFGCRRSRAAWLQPFRRVAVDAGLASLSENLRDLLQRERVG